MGIVQEGAQGIFFMVIKIFCILTVVVITLVYKFVKNNRNVFFMGAFLLNAKLNKADLPKNMQNKNIFRQVYMYHSTEFSYYCTEKKEPVKVSEMRISFPSAGLFFRRSLCHQSSCAGG